MIRAVAILLMFWSAALVPQAHAAAPRPVELHFFWSTTCPHCAAARPFVAKLPDRLPGLIVRSYEVTGDVANRERFRMMAEELEEEAQAVPAFIYCGRMEVGFDTDETTGRALEESLRRCQAGEAELGPLEMRLPVLGRVDPARWSLPVFTLVIAGLDAFNPCAFFVLLFLLSLMVHARSRTRMIYVGGVFLFFSGLIYFLFMAAWLNVFRWLGEMAMVTLAAGIVAVMVGLVNIKDYFLFGLGPSLSIPAAAKPGLFERMRGLLRADHLPALTVGTAVLAVAANSYELLCTAGFPMVYTRVLTLAELPTAAYYAYLAAYNVIYVLPLLAITLVFAWTLGARKLSETEGRFLKLLSGAMMLGLGGVLVVAPAALAELGTALALLGGACGVALLVHRLASRR